MGGTQMVGTVRAECKIGIGTWLINSADDPHTELILLEAHHSTDILGDSCRVAIYAPSARNKSLLDEAAGAAMEMAGGVLGLNDGSAEKAFSIQVRGNAINPGDPVTIELAVGDRSNKVITADVQSITSSFRQTVITGTTGKQKLANTRLNQIYENRTMFQIVKDLASQAEAEMGDVATGSTYAYFVVHESKSLLRHIRELAIRDGLDLYFDTENKLTLKAFEKSSADHTFHYGIDILDLQLWKHQPTSNHLMVYGESPSSNQGSSTWHWLAKDLKPFRSEVGMGAHLLGISDSAVRTKDAADSLAKAKFGAMKDQASVGRIKILGNPMVKLGDAIEIADAPKPELNGLFKVVSVRHRYSKHDGFVTVVEFTGQGGAAAAEGLLGQAVGQLAGALGL